jgi:hypothetical protein
MKKILYKLRLGAKDELAHTHATIVSLKKELANVITTVENMKKGTSGKN